MKIYIAPAINITMFSSENISTGKEGASYTYAAAQLNNAMLTNEEVMGLTPGTVTVRLKTVQNIVKMQ